MFSFTSSLFIHTVLPVLFFPLLRFTISRSKVCSAYC